MRRHLLAPRRLVAPLLLLALLAAATLSSCAPGAPGAPAPAPAPDLDAALRRITREERFSIAAWELEQLVGPREPETPFALPDASLVTLYFEVVGRHRQAEQALERALAAPPPHDPAALAALREARDVQARNLAQLRPHAQRILGAQVREAYRAEGIYNSSDRLVRVPISFPPLAFTLEPLPHLLIVSPRERIESVSTVLLAPELTVEQMEAIEAEVQALGYAALIEPIGGLGATYPTFVQESTNLPWTVNVVAEEWLHQYLALTPVGSRYVLHLLRLRADYGIARVNESAATIVSEEIGRAVLTARYPQFLPTPTPTPVEEPAAADSPAEPEGFVFNREMRVTRLRVDELLAAGQVEAAEAYMEERRLVFVAEGYTLRKLNQAYFAFHGSYAVPSSQEAPLPPALVDPLGADLTDLRAQSASLADFLDAVAAMRSEDDMRRALGE